MANSAEVIHSRDTQKREIEDRIVRMGVCWSNVSKLMRLRISQLSTAIPLIGYGFLWSEQFKHALILQSALGQGIWSDTTGRLMLVYFGALALSVAWILFALRCPEFIKRFPVIDDYLFQQTQLHDKINYGKVITLMRGLVYEKENDGPVVRKFLDFVPATLSDEIRAEHIISMTRSPHSSEHVSGLYRVYYHWKDGTGVWFAFASMMFFFVGVALVLVPSVEVFLLVIGKMLSMLVAT